jgi:hypothetical protein
MRRWMESRRVGRAPEHAYFDVHVRYSMEIVEGQTTFVGLETRFHHRERREHRAIAMTHFAIFLAALAGPGLIAPDLANTPCPFLESSVYALEIPGLFYFKEHLTIANGVGILLAMTGL